MNESLTLYEMTDELTDLMEDVNAAEDEAEREAAVAKLADMGEALLQKVDRYSQYMSHLESQSALAKTEIERLAARRKRFEKALEWLAQNALYIMERKGWQELQGETVTLKARNNPPAVEVTDEAVIPAEYITVTQITAVNKVAVKAALKAGEQVPGATLIQRKSLVRK